MGNAYLKLHQVDSAKKLYAGLANYSPGYYHYFMAYTAAVSGDIQGAYMEIDNSIDADPDNQQPYELAVKIAQQTKDQAKQEEYYDKYKKAFPEQEDK